MIVRSLARCIPLLLIIAVVSAREIPAVPSASSTSSAKKKYLGKDYIDSTVLRAIFIISDAAGTAGVGFRTKESLDEAWRIARKVKSEVKGDPNERYALWKVNELEWLIRLEERDLVMEKMREGQATVNQIIAEYNKEVGKSRPDFKNLLRMHGRILEYDTRQADAMAGSLNNRIRTLSREAVLGLERALLARNSVLVDQEYKYLLRNRPYLKLADRTFDDLESRASACVRARDEIPTVADETEKARDYLRRVNPGDARQQLTLANNRFSDIRSYIPDHEVTRLYRGISAVERRLSAIEDSLVRVNLAILAEKGVNPANDYLQRVVREKGVCRDKVARVDQAILAVGTPEKTGRMEREIGDVASAVENTPENDVIGEMRSRAMKKAQKKLDSMRLEEERRARFEKKRRDSIEAVALKAATEEARKNRERSVQFASKIYDLVENKKARLAFDLFTTKQALFKEYLSPDAYMMLAATVRQASDPNWDSGGDQIVFLAPVSDHADRTAASGSFPAGAATKREKAIAIVTEIYAMLDRNHMAEAQGRFDREKGFLSANLDRDAYEMIKASVAPRR